MIKKGELYFPSDDFSKKAVVNSNKIYKEAAKDPLLFWEKAAESLVWKKKWDKIFTHIPPHFQWFEGGKLNITESCLDENLKNRKDKIALIWEAEPVEEKNRTFTYGELYKEVNKLANALKKLGVKKGDRVGIYLPMIPEVVISMLACARIGAVHAVVFSAFSPQALKVRLEDTEAKVLITVDGYYRRGKVIELKKAADEGIKETKVEKVIVVRSAENEIPFNEGKDVYYDDLTKNESDFCEAEEMDSEDLFFILYTSGSTGKPKGTVQTCGGYAVQAKITGKWIVDLKEDDVFWSTADVGWITGHTYTVYSPLLNGTTFLMFEGAPDYPETDRWCDIIEKHNVTTFYTAPTAIRMFEKYGEDIVLKHEMKSLQLLGSVGEPIDEDAWHFYFEKVGKERCPVVDTWWQTETGGILITSLPGIGPFKPAFAGLPFPAVRFEILDDKGKPCKKGKQGNLVMLPPFAPGLLRGIYKDEEKYLNTYFSQYGKETYFTSDAAYFDKNNLLRIVGRVDDVIKVAGHRVTTGELENAVAKHKDITESAVVGMPDEIKGEVPIVFVILQNKRDEAELKKEVIGSILKEIGPIAIPKEIYIVSDLPKTRSGKIMRRILKKLLIKEDLGDLSTLTNPESVDEVKKKIYG